GESRCTSTRKLLQSIWRREDDLLNFKRLKNCPLQVELPTSGDNHHQGFFGLPQHFHAIGLVNLSGLGVCKRRDPQMLRADIVHGSGADENRVRRGSKQAHDEAVARIRTADSGAARVARNLIADYTIESGNEVPNDIRQHTFVLRKTQVPTVELS